MRGKCAFWLKWPNYRPCTHNALGTNSVFFNCPVCFYSLNVSSRWSRNAKQNILKDKFSSCHHSCAGTLCNMSVFLFCFLQRHDECADQEPTECTCGLLRDHILPPWAIYPVIKVQNYPLTHLKHTYSTNSACHTNTEHNISPRLFLVVGKTFSPVWCVDRFMSIGVWTFIRFSLVYSLCTSVLVPKGETKQCQEWLLKLNRWQWAQYYSWRTSASGIILPTESFYQYWIFNE